MWVDLSLETWKMLLKEAAILVAAPRYAQGVPGNTLTKKKKIVTEQVATTRILKKNNNNNERQAQQITEVENPRILKKKKKTNPNIEQITRCKSKPKDRATP